MSNRLGAICRLSFFSSDFTPKIESSITSLIVINIFLSVISEFPLYLIPLRPWDTPFQSRPNKISSCKFRQLLSFNFHFYSFPKLYARNHYYIDVSMAFPVLSDSNAASITCITRSACSGFIVSSAFPSAASINWS